MAEWSKAAVLKTVERKFRGFESYSLRQPLAKFFLIVYRDLVFIAGTIAERWPSRLKALAC